MTICRLNELPPPPTGKTGWPWTEESVLSSSAALSNVEWPRITIVTPSYNQAIYLEETIRSILLQGYPNLEYIVMDGGSTDGSVEIIKKYQAWIHHWKSGRDGGQTAAIVAGLKKSTGKVVFEYRDTFK